MKNKIKIWKSIYEEISEKEWNDITDVEEQAECFSLVDWDGEPVAFFRIKKTHGKEIAKEKK